jgi:methylated-DNA-[protein]-cysteine S-methyltransferase
MNVPKYKYNMILSFQETAIGRIGIGEREGAVTNLYFGTDRLQQQVEIGETELIREAFRQLDAYLKGELRVFSLPLAPSGTPFMQSVWRQLCTIPYGCTASYRQIATAAGNSRAVRAVGMANHRNPIPVFIPCHRVIGSDGSLTGYRGGLSVKEALLELERTVSGQEGGK